MMHIHITGASGSGTTTLGLALAELLGIRHLDTDHFFWMPTDPPFTTQREVGARIAMLRQEALPDAGWVLSGSAVKWGAEFEPLYDLVVFLRIDPMARMERIRRREEEHYGERIRPGGDMAVKSREFMDWAESYDTAGPERRSLVGHEEWLKTLTRPILRLDSSRPVGELVGEVLSHPAVIAGRPQAS
ncbi:AAA family ATPase [Rhizobium sp. CF142]|uniref:AAA family ATPase n=1 Tax=Rhizobium sp. CF142 TaxID=1144314 RepID=UPI00056015F2|nr:AAA family ATPase [Rhizobium sp. CF142]